MNRSNGLSLLGIFAAPIVIAVLSLVGLVAGLLGSDLFDLLSWAALFVPVLVIGWAFAFRRS